MPLQDYFQPSAHEDVYRLVSVGLSVPTDEQLAKVRAKVADMPAHVSLRVEWEPLTYRHFIGEDQINEVEYIRITKGRGLSIGNEAENLARVRDGGLPAIPADARLNPPMNISKADPLKQTQEWPRFFVAAVKAGIGLDVDKDGKVTGKPGEIYATGIGKIYACQSPTQLPTVNQTADGKFDSWNWDETKASFIRIPVREVTDFVQPDTIPDRRYERKEQDAGTATTTTAAPAPVSTADLKAAVRLLGIDGKTVSTVNAAATSLVASNVAKAPAVLGTGSVARAAQSGKFADWLVEQGVAAVTDGKVALVG